MKETGTRKETKKNEKEPYYWKKRRKKKQIRIIGTGRHRRGGLRICLA